MIYKCINFNTTRNDSYAILSQIYTWKDETIPDQLYIVPNEDGSLMVCDNESRNGQFCYHIDIDRQVPSINKIISRLDRVCARAPLQFGLLDKTLIFIIDYLFLVRQCGQINSDNLWWLALFNFSPTTNSIIETLDNLRKNIPIPVCLEPMTTEPAINKYLKLELFQHQLENITWMSNIESQIRECNYNVYYLNENRYRILKRSDHPDIYLNVYNNNLLLKEQLFTHSGLDSLSMYGGVICDSIGKGKTATMIGHIIKNTFMIKLKIHFKGIKDIKDIEPKSTTLDSFDQLVDQKHVDHSAIPQCSATLIICPRRLSFQWNAEITKFVNDNCGLNVIMFNTINDYKKHDIATIMNAHIIIISSSFLEGKSYAEAITNKTAFNFSKIYWERVVVDEAHELLIPTANDNLFKIQGRYKWLLSATPLDNGHASFHYLLCFLQNRKNSDTTHIKKIKNTPIYSKSTIDAVIEYRFRKNDTSAIYIPPYKLHNEILDFNDIERSVYDTCGLTDPDELTKLCTNILLNKATGGTSCAPQDVANNMIIHYGGLIDHLEKSNISMTNKSADLQQDLRTATLTEDKISIKGKIKRLDANIQKNIDQIIQLTSTVDHFKTYSITGTSAIAKKDNCRLCGLEMITYYIQPNGHTFCNLCIGCLTDSQTTYQCPVTGDMIRSCDLVKITHDASKTLASLPLVTTDLASRWGTKMAFIYDYICKHSNSKILIFSQFDKMLDQIAEMFKFYYINYILCRGNVYQITKSINEFKTNPACNVMLLSAETSNSGFNLTEVSHILLIDTITHQNHSTMEAQAIGRSVRLGQVKNVIVSRLIIRDTIEHTTYLTKFPEISS